MITRAFNEFGVKLYEMFVFLLGLFVGYFSPMKSVVHMVLVFFLVDVIYGWLAAKKLRGESFKPAIVWKKTMPRVLLSLVLLILAYIIDKETKQALINTTSVLGWGISALLFLSIAKNGYIVTKWKSIPILEKWVEDKIEKETGIKIKDEDI